MPLYVVRWPNLSAALVRARNERQLIDILDEVANPDGCTWEVYRGPVFLDLELGARIEIEGENGESQEPGRPLDPARLRIVGARDMASCEVPAMTIRSIGETGGEMEQAIAEFAFPATAAVYWGGEDEIDAKVLEKALEEDAMRLVEYTWRHSQLYRSADPDARLALMMDASLRWVKDTGAPAPGQGEDDAEERERASIAKDLYEQLAVEFEPGPRLVGLGGLEELDDESDDEFDEDLDDDDLDDDDLDDEEPDPVEDVAALLDMARAEWLEVVDPTLLRDTLLEIVELLDDEDIFESEE